MAKILMEARMPASVETSVLLRKGSVVINVIEEPWNNELSVVCISPKEKGELVCFDFYAIPIGSEMEDISEIGKYYSTVSLNGQKVSIFERLKKESYEEN
jgi:hypothetical protein